MSRGHLLPSDKEELPSDILEKYICAGKIAAKVREDIKRSVKEGMLLLEVCEMVEEKIRGLGGKPAFPCNISVNEVAAHYTSPPEDDRKIPEGALVKIDIGVHVDGYIADTATTLCFNPTYEDMVYAAEKALENAINLMRPGMLIPKISSEIQATIERFGFKPISNLTGHEVDRYVIHSGKTIPNVSHLSMDKVHLGRVYAVEPFVTLKEAFGKVKDGPEKHIFRLIKRKSLKDPNLHGILKFIEENFKTLPFAERWIKKYYSKDYAYRKALSDLLSLKCLVAYPVFIEASLKPVAQAEHTIYVSREGPIVLT
ncbi:MAG: type II methionyl aminopeptidase [Candidatus Bathyarchaeia archaeon]|nr:type II methionyl aminopeptidase [Candidatus Bathyarchaeota archaeon]